MDPGQVEHAAEEGEEGEDHERDAHDPRRLVRGVQRRLAVRSRLVEAGLAPEGEHLQPAHVVRREHGGDEPDDPEHLVVGEHVVEHVALGPEARQRRDAGDGEEADR